MSGSWGSGSASSLPGEILRSPAAANYESPMDSRKIIAVLITIITILVVIEILRSMPLL